MKIWEIAKGMSEGEFVEGQVFTNIDRICGDIIIDEYGHLVYMNNFYTVTIILDDEIEWELKPKEMDWELKITEKYGN